MGEWRSSMCRTLAAVVADLHAGSSVLYGRFMRGEAVSGIRQSAKRLSRPI